MFKTKKYNYRYDYSAAMAVLEQLDGSKNAPSEDIVRTRSFVASVFSEFESGEQLEKVRFAFVIPTRASRGVEEYWEEVYDFLPALKYLSKGDAFKVLSSLPPFRIEMYGEKGSHSSGVLVFCPLFNDMVKDIKSKLALKRMVTKRINDTIDFAHRRFDVEYVGLGATLPKLTKYGKTIKADVVTTTGHAGTVYLIIEQVRALINERILSGAQPPRIGFIGGGAIGLASMLQIAALYPDLQYLIYDKRPNINKINKKKLRASASNSEIASSNRELLEQSDIIVSAITSTIDISGLDISGKTIVDDSQPGSFNRDQVFNSGGELIWVVGHDSSKESFVTRRQGYSYGPHGLHSNADIWGCEAEVAAIARFDNPAMAVKNAVTPQDVETIGKAFRELGLGLAEKQSHGQLNS